MFHLDVGAHPRVDAALEVLYLVGVELRGVQPARSDEVIGLERRALGRDRRVAREIIQQWDDAAAELGDAGEGVDLATHVQCKDILAGIELDVLRREVPLRRLLGLRELRDEAIERYMPLLDADSWIVEDGIER